MLESRIRKDRLVPFQSNCRCPVYSHVLHDSINSLEHFEYGMIHALGFAQLYNIVIVIYRKKKSKIVYGHPRNTYTFDWYLRSNWKLTVHIYFSNAWNEKY